MKINKTLFLVCALFFNWFVTAQLKTLKGKVVADDDVENIHVLNKSALKFTTTNTDGTFEILVKVTDTLTISSLKYQLEEVVITTEILNIGYIQVSLTEKVNQLDQVVIGKILTGNLDSDINNLDVKTDINFYDLGIPGYTGKLPTLAERKLIAATGSGGGVSIVGLINAITGKTKYYKSLVKLERRERCLNQLKDAYSESIFENKKMVDSLKLQYFEYAADDSNFESICKEKGSLNQLEFLIQKLKDFKIQIKSKDED
ncbi:carboxypeptidase-like regulatory domain-containing protein [Winogradskyella immobilis]|uniref:CarboxypepD_reg-like domain-containing protein n=1 Tax=Winogradskyella immobilis TaxID=2816852 RepID=A0ABS8EL62_9FLAO|nr:carboxypeptidase-like regulatory domain-containing protein [Winogradskyella immobilis]MCC1483946.1 hypothetical protein [Winogradskyella immobilis]MCG0016038.1 carboxypeptidase-like regulatory domain-containing protein [Winogradskyella immobilis]